MSTLLDVRQVSRSFGDVTALDHVSFEIEDNEFFALLGPSGCGKTTLLRTLAGFESPDSGQVLLDGTDLLGRPAHRRPVNLMFQSYALFPHLSVAKNVAYGLEAEHLPSDQINTRVHEVLETVGLVKEARRRPHQLSGGQRQRVALARAIVKRPRLLLLDEPLSALDRRVRADMQLELKRLQAEVGLTFVVVTHDQEEALSMADRVLVLKDGAVEQLDTPVDLYQRPRTRFVADFIGVANLLDGTAVDGGVVLDGIGLLPAPHDLPTGAPASVVLRPEQLRVVEPSAADWSGEVVDVTFLGGRSTVAVAVPGLSRPMRSTQPGVTTVRRGDQVGLQSEAGPVVVGNA